MAHVKAEVLVDALADMLPELEVETVSFTLVEVQTKVLLASLDDTVSKVEAKTLSEQTIV